MKRIGVVGIGIMGGGIAASLLRKGFAVSVWNRSQEKCASLVQSGASLAPDPLSVAAESDVVVTVLRDDQVVREVLLEQMLPHAKPGTTFIDMSTVTPAMSRNLAQAARSRGCHFLDAPVMGSKEAAENGQLTILVGGPAETLEAQQDVLSAMGQKIVHVGPNGSSAFLKLACNQFVAGIIAGVGEGLALAKKGGVDRQTAVDIFMGTMARVAVLKHSKIADRDWATHFALDLMFKDLVQAQQAADEVKLPMPVLSAVTDTFERVRRQGIGELDFSVVADPEGVGA
jgi:3-hydroxyisobutyrate dehydrogenase